MTRNKLYAVAAAVVAVAALGGAAAALVPSGTLDRFVGDAHPAGDVAAAGQEYQQIPMPEGSWEHGTHLYFEPGRGTSGNTITVTSDTPDVCEPYGSTSSQLRFVGTGGCAVTLTQAGDGTFAPATVKLTRQVTPRTLLVSAVDTTRPANKPNPTFEADYSGFVLGDTAADLAAEPQFMAPPLSAPPGTYPVVPFGAVASNYAFDYTPGVLTIDPVLTVTTIPTGTLPQEVVVPYGTAATLAPAKLVTGVFYVSTDVVPAQVVRNQSLTYTTIPVQIAQASLTYSTAGLLRSKWDEFVDAYVAGDVVSARTRMADLKHEAGAVSGTGALVAHLEVIEDTML